MTTYAEPRLFKMIRDYYVVAYGCMFPNGKCTINLKEYDSIIIFDSLNDLKNNNGDSQLVFYY